MGDEDATEFAKEVRKDERELGVEKRHERKRLGARWRLVLGGKG